MLLKTLILSCLLYTFAAQAQTADDIDACKSTQLQYSQFVSASDKKINYELCLASKKHSRAANTLNSQLQTLKEKEPTCFPDERGFWGRMINKTQRSPTAADVDRCDKERIAKETQLALLDKGIKEHQQDLEKAEANYKNKEKTTQTSAAERERINGVVEEGNFLVGTNFDTMKMSIFDFKLRSAEAELTLTKMATALDNSAMGLYMRERMAGLLNSTAMCDAVKECPGPRKIKGSDLNSVFNSTMNTGVNAELEVHSSAPGGQKADPAGSAK